jgi:xylulokinase
LGAAKLAVMAVTGATTRQACAPPPLSGIVEPDPLLAERLAPRLARFRAAYAALRSL